MAKRSKKPAPEMVSVPKAAACAVVEEVAVNWVGTGIDEKDLYFFVDRARCAAGNSADSILAIKKAIVAAERGRGK